MKSKSPKAPKVADPVPVPQPDSPELIDTRRTTRAAAEQREGSTASLLTPGGAKGVASSDSERKRLGYSSIASGF